MDGPRSFPHTTPVQFEPLDRTINDRSICWSHEPVVMYHSTEPTGLKAAIGGRSAPAGSAMWTRMVHLQWDAMETGGDPGGLEVPAGRVSARDGPDDEAETGRIGMEDRCCGFSVCLVRESIVDLTYCGFERTSSKLVWSIAPSGL